MLPFLLQGFNPYHLHWCADSLPLRHQGSPKEQGMGLFKKKKNIYIYIYIYMYVYMGNTVEIVLSWGSVS